MTPKKAEYCGSAPSVPVSEVHRPGSGESVTNQQITSHSTHPLSWLLLLLARVTPNCGQWAPYTLSNFLLGHFLSLRECFWHQQQ